SDIERHVQLQLVVDLKNDVFRGVRTKSRGGYVDLVISRRQREEVVRTILIGGGLLFQVGIAIGDGNASTGDDTLRTIVENTLNRAGDVGFYDGRTKQQH